MSLNSKTKRQNLSETEDGSMQPNSTQDILFGMKSIAAFLGRSESTIIKYIREYDDFPVRKDIGSGYISSRTELQKWFRDFVRNK